MKSFLKVFICSLCLALVPVSSQGQDVLESANTPLDRIESLYLKGHLRAAEAALQKTYYLLNSPRYDEARFGRESSGPANNYDCSATVIQRQFMEMRQESRHFDPYGLLWKPWMAEADRLYKQGVSKKIGRIGDVDIVVHVPRQRYHRRAASYRRITAQLSGFVSRYGEPIRKWSKEVFKKQSIQPWTQGFAWPPDFLLSRIPVLESYFDEHPVYDAGRTKRWSVPLEKFLHSVKINKGQEDLDAESSKTWHWFLSDRVRRSSLVWTPKGESFLFLSMPCLDGLVDNQWSRQPEWVRPLYEITIHELMLAYYLNNRPKSFMRDPMMDALAQGAAQPYLGRPGPLYTHGPFYTELNAVSLSNEKQLGYVRFGTSPYWNYLYRLKGEKFLANYVKKARKPARYLESFLDQGGQSEKLRISFSAWLLGLFETPAALREGLPIWHAHGGRVRPHDVDLQAVVPPKGVIGSADNPFQAHSMRLFQFPVKNAESILGLNVRWEPSAPKLMGYLFLAGERVKGSQTFLGYTQIKPGVVQQVFLDPFAPAREAYFVVWNPSRKRFESGELQLQVSVVPRPSAQVSLR